MVIRFKHFQEKLVTPIVTLKIKMGNHFFLIRFESSNQFFLERFGLSNHVFLTTFGLCLSNHFFLDKV